MTTTVDYEFRSDLDARGLPVPAEVRDQILACSDLTQLDTWLRRATVATAIDDVIRG